MGLHTYSCSTQTILTVFNTAQENIWSCRCLETAVRLQMGWAQQSWHWAWVIGCMGWLCYQIHCLLHCTNSYKEKSKSSSFPQKGMDSLPCYPEFSTNEAQNSSCNNDIDEDSCCRAAHLLPGIVVEALMVWLPNMVYYIMIIWQRSWV